jgi:nickel-dependent lactate racemase
LIHRGHAPEHFIRPVKNGGYTYDQVWLFYKAAQLNAQDEYKSNLYAMRVATQADAKGFKKYMRDMEINQAIKENTGKQVTKQSLKMLSGMMGGK